MKMNQNVRMTIRRILVAILVFIFAISPTMASRVSATTAQRNSAIVTMTLMRNFIWVPNGSVSITGKEYALGGSITGMPYTQSDDANTTLPEFKTSPTMQYVYSGNFYYFSQPVVDVGNDCTSSVAISWSSAGSAINYKLINTSQMLSSVKSSSCYMAKRGTYTTYSYDTSTITISHRVTPEALYNTIVPGDACFYKTSTGGHAILITGINTSANTVTYIEQVGSGSLLTSTHSTWSSGVMTYQQLYSAGYVPIRCTDI